MNQPLTEALNGINLYLIGMMGVGKTAVGQCLADALGYRFIDVDALIEQVAGQTISELFAGQGEDAFRQLESRVLAELSAYAYQKLAIATGGGIVLRRENWSYLHHGIVIWLDVPITVLCDRLQQDQSRPLLQNTTNLEQKLQKLLDQRRGLYAQADIQVVVQGSHTPAEVAQQIIVAIPQILKSRSQSVSLGQNQTQN